MSDPLPVHSVLTRTPRPVDEHGRPSAPVGPAHDQLDAPLRLVWNERALVTTGPETYRLTLPIVGRPPGTEAVRAMAAELTDRCRTQDAAREAVTVRTVQARIEARTPFRSHLALFVTTNRVDEGGDLELRRVTDRLRAALADTAAIRLATR